MMKSVPEGETLLGHLVKETDDRDVIKDETLNILIAGEYSRFFLFECRLPFFYGWSIYQGFVSASGYFDLFSPFLASSRIDG